MKIKSSDIKISQCGSQSVKVLGAILLEKELVSFTEYHEQMPQLLVLLKTFCLFVQKVISYVFMYSLLAYSSILYYF